MGEQAALLGYWPPLSFRCAAHFGLLPYLRPPDRGGHGRELTSILGYTDHSIAVSITSTRLGSIPTRERVQPPEFAEQTQSASQPDMGIKRGTPNSSVGIDFNSLFL